jgi:hypothetical protein
MISETPCVATVHDDDQGVEPGPPHPSAHLSRDVSTGIHGWPIYYHDLHPGGMVGHCPTKRPSKLLSLRDPINPAYADT